MAQPNRDEQHSVSGVAETKIVLGAAATSAEMDRPSRDQLHSLSGEVLSTMCRERGLKVTGNKDAKVNRLLKNWDGTGR